MNTNILSGKNGEDCAATYLIAKGYKIIERNFKKRYGEIDIIALDRDTLVFVEVKTRSSNAFGYPLESITPWKLKTVIKTAEYYVLTHKNLPKRLRIDAISIMLSGNETPLIEHIENITG